MYKTLLLNSSYEPLNFISFRKLVKLVVKNKVEVISTWDDKSTWGYGGHNYPSIVRMIYFVRRQQMKIRFNRRGIFRRDLFTCQYCGVVLSPSKLTIDHVVPTSRGGKKASWENALTACLPCNAKKADRTPEQARMKMLSKPEAPRKTLDNEYILTIPKHAEWRIYFPHVEYIEPPQHIDI